MAQIRPLVKTDIPDLKELHDKYYSEFEFPNFDNLVAKFVIVDDNGDTIIGGGVRVIAETLLITDQEKSRIQIGRALVEAQRASLFACSRLGIDELHAFVKNEEYAKHLIKHGFSPRSQALSMRL